MEHRIRPYPSGWQLEIKRVIETGPRKGETDWDAIGWYQTLEVATSTVFDRKLKVDFDPAEIKELIRKALDEVEDIVCDLKGVIHGR